MSRVYLETSVVSYLTAPPNRSSLIATCQQATRDWWKKNRKRYEIFASQLVIQEASAGNKAKAAKRLELIADLPILDVTDNVLELAETLIRRGALPEKAAADAAHMAIATVYGIDFLLTWNCKHLANAHIRRKIDEVCREASYTPSIICTPLELTEVDYDQ